MMATQTAKKVKPQSIIIAHWVSVRGCRFFKQLMTENIFGGGGSAMLTVFVQNGVHGLKGPESSQSEQCLTAATRTVYSVPGLRLSTMKLVSSPECIWKIRINMWHKLYGIFLIFEHSNAEFSKLTQSCYCCFVFFS